MEILMNLPWRSRNTMSQARPVRYADGTIIKRTTTEMVLVMLFTSLIQPQISPYGARKRNKLLKEKVARQKEKEKAKTPHLAGRKMNAPIRRTANGSILATSLRAA